MTTSRLAAKLHLVQCQTLPIFEQLQIEEALLRADERNWCLINAGTLPAIVMGISGKAECLIDPVAFAKRPVPIIKRFSGGGTVFVDLNTIFVTWIFNVDHIDVACCPCKIHQWTADFYQSAFPSLGLSLKENDYVIEERKWGGNAQYLRKGRWLHHTSMLWDYDPQGMDYLLMPARKPAYRKERSHAEFLCRLRDYVTDRQLLENQILTTLNQRFAIVNTPLEQIHGVLKRPHRQATHYVDFK